MDIIEETLDRRRWLTPLTLAVLCVILIGPRLSEIEQHLLSGGNDTINWFYPYLSYIAQSVRGGEFPLWNPHQFSGYSNVANPQLGLFYPATWLILALPVNVALALSTVFHVWLAGIGMVTLLRSFGGTRLGSLLAGVVFMFSEYMAARIWAGHYTLLLVSCWLPWVLASYRWAVQRGHWSAAALAGATMALAVLAGHPTTLVYPVLGVVGFWLYEMLTRRQFKIPTRQMLVMGLAAGALAAVLLLPSFESIQLVSRSRFMVEGAGSLYAMAPAQLVTAAIADFFGNVQLGDYWGAENFHELAFYASLFPLMGAVVALRKRLPATGLFLGLGALGVISSLGNTGGL